MEQGSQGGRTPNAGTEAMQGARELPPLWLRWGRWVVPTVSIGLIIGGIAYSLLDNPERHARQRWDAALEAAHGGDTDAALGRLDEELARDVALVDAERAERAGAEVVRLAASRVAAPLTAETVDQATRVIARYQALPGRAQGGAAVAAMLAALDGWMQALGDAARTAEARLALLGAAAGAGDALRAASAGRITAVRLAAAAAKAGAPLDALAILIDHGRDGAGDAERQKLVAAADAVVAELGDAPALLLDADEDLDAWRAATRDAAARTRIDGLVKLVQDARTEAEADGVTPAQLTANASRRSWDQFAVVQLARGEMTAGKLDAAAARLTALGPPGRTIRGARRLLAQIAAAQGKLDAADAMFDALLAGWLPRFTAASRAFEDTATRVENRLRERLRSGSVPSDLIARYEASRDEAARTEMIQRWFRDEATRDPGLTAARARHAALSGVVPVAVEAGSVKLRRAQALSGAARQAMLQSAERLFLAIRSEAEGDPSFRLALGEIYARLGKTAESETELSALLAKRDPQLGLAVAEVYRGLGSLARARQIANDAYATARSPVKEDAAYLLAVLSLDDEPEAERWYRKADQTQAGVRAALLEIEASALSRAGKDTECAAKYAAAAKLELDGHAATSESVAYNNAALKYRRGYECSGDPQALRQAEAALERAYRSSPGAAILIENLIEVLEVSGELRVLGRRVDLRALRLRRQSVHDVLKLLRDGPERAALLADLDADPGVRRARELQTQLEVLAPNNPVAYLLRFATARDSGDAAAAAGVVERARAVKTIDRTRSHDARERWRSGAEDARWLAAFDSDRIRLQAVLAGPGAARLDARTRAVAHIVLARQLSVLGVFRNDPALLAQARAAAAAAAGWPALDHHALIVGALIDEAGLAADAKAWTALRRDRDAVSALDKLVADRSPLGAKLRAAVAWPEIARHAAADTTEPTVYALRLARLLGDAALEARARPVLDDRLAHLGLELALALDPDDEDAKADLALLDAR